MRTIKFLLQKEFRQIFRNKAILMMVIFMPIMQLIILPLAADYEIKNINLSVVDNDHSILAKDLITSITASQYFKLQQYGADPAAAYNYIEQDKSDLLLEIPNGFERNLLRNQKENLYIAINAINGIKANLGGAYLNQLIAQFEQKHPFPSPMNSAAENTPHIQIASSNWYNPQMNYRFFMVPGILSILVTMVGGFLSALNIVKEKEVGTIEQINVTPIKKHLFILGKLIPFWILGNIVFTLGLIVSYLFYGIVPLGSLFVLYGFVWLFLLAVLGFGLLISTYSETQQQAMFIMFFFMMIFILMSGLFTPIESMPHWAQFISDLNPVSYFVKVMRMVILKGSSWKEIYPQMLPIAGFALLLNTWAIIHYKKTS